MRLVRVPVLTVESQELERKPDRQLQSVPALELQRGLAPGEELQLAPRQQGFAAVNGGSLCRVRK